MSDTVRIVYTGYMLEVYVPGIGGFVRNEPTDVTKEQADTLLKSHDFKKAAAAKVTADDKKEE